MKRVSISRGGTEHTNETLGDEDTKKNNRLRFSRSVKPLKKSSISLPKLVKDPPIEYDEHTIMTKDGKPATNADIFADVEAIQ